MIVPKFKKNSCKFVYLKKTPSKKARKISISLLASLFDHENKRIKKARKIKVF